ncbi:DUF2158 domain-containing protein [Variovorax sp. ZT5P49]|uniref:DUF2158 domain-containing protein n=1 Tax=Variovorax sp. ZT5P49 TaxID=3443733 RepID=UPI003F47C88A
MSDVKPGDVVKLKSGGVAMTVQWISGEAALCVWQEGARPIEQKYNVVVLEKFEPVDLKASFEKLGKALG